MIDTVKTLIRYMLDAHKAYNETGMMMALYFVMLLIIIFYCTDKKLKKSIILPSIFIIIVMYVLVPIYDTFVEYWEFYDGRLFWLLLTPVIISIGFTIFISGIDDRKMRVLALILVVPICVYSGKFMISDSMYHRVENAYRLPQSTVDITEHITAECEEPVICVPYTIAHPFRQISSKVKLLFGENADLGRIKPAKEFKYASDEMERVTPNLNYLVPLCRRNNVNYILFDTVYTEFCDNGNINIYGYEADKNYVGDRSPTVSFDDLKSIKVIDDEKGIYWDLSEYGLTYDGTYGQYILYKFD